MNNLIKLDHQIIAIDEVARGNGAGPVVVVGVVMDPNWSHPDINDSKKLTKKKRHELRSEIEANVIEKHISALGPDRIAELNILGATMKGMNDCVTKLYNTPLPYPRRPVYIDGNIWRPEPENSHTPVTTIVKGDSKYHDIACASILAKCTLDDIMIVMHEKYPQYGFDQHSGYLTKKHTNAILEHGPCEYHRMSFIQKWI